MSPFLPILIPLIAFVIITVVGIKKANIFPDIASVTVLFRERFLTGHSGGLLGTYRNILEVVVTDQELWIRTLLPFIGFAAIFKGIHKIPVSNIRKIETRHNEMTIYFATNEGKYAHLSFFLLQTTSRVH